MVTVWRNAIEAGSSSYEELKKRKVIAQGWSVLGDLADFLQYSDRNQFYNEMDKLFDRLKLKTKWNWDNGMCQ